MKKKSNSKNKKIAVKEQELLTLDEKKELEKESVAKETSQLIELEKTTYRKSF